MQVSVKDMSVDDLRVLIEETVRRALEDHLEDLQALSSSTFVDSVAEAREELRKGQGVPLERLLDE